MACDASQDRAKIADDWRMVGSVAYVIEESYTRVDTPTVSCWNPYNRTEASYLMTELARRILEEEADVLAKLRYIQRTVAYAKNAVAVEDANELRLLMVAPDTAKYFAGSTFSVHDGSYRSVAAKNAETQLKAVMSYVAASGLVFAHSFLEFALETLLQMTRLCDIAPWLSFIGNKDVSISAIVETGLEPAIETKLNKFIASLYKEGLLDKVDYLAKVSSTPRSVRDRQFPCRTSPDTLLIGCLG
jgi:hypothetical protein